MCPLEVKAMNEHPERDHVDAEAVMTSLIVLLFMLLIAIGASVLLEQTFGSPFTR